MFEGELNFALMLAREMGKPNWRAMLAGMSSSDYADWKHFYGEHFFRETQMDAHFSMLTYAVLGLFFADENMSPSDFSLLHPVNKDEEGSEDQLMDKAEGLYGGVRFGAGATCEEVTTDAEDDSDALMAVSKKITGGVRYEPASR
ncbi:TPA: phage tail assembly protein T [Salmonella enterica]|nr:phage tail assembly protein T [Salmonella enterica]HEB0795936.1 phage tail assembly protein T [Salmonella enterica]HEB0806444.1 phage tail assembly protein T [Salmonella enterica]HEB0810743.1 phage tail assembly protein T [Salmonella enterica]HEB0815318.1 phage tail assembly protein T [Salmonella enterica]